MPDLMFEIGQRLCQSLGIDRNQARRLTDSEREAIALEICRRTEIASKLIVAGKLGAIMANGSPGERRKRVERMQADADRIAAINTKQSWRRVAQQVGRIHGVSARTIRRYCVNPQSRANGLT